MQTVEKTSEKAVLPNGYEALLKEIKEKVRTSQLKTAFAVNSELIHLS